MISINGNELDLVMQVGKTIVKLDEDHEVSVKDYLSIDEKTEVIQYIVNAALDENTGCFSPLRIEIYFALAICKWYANIQFDDSDNVGEVYDILETNGIINKVMGAIPDGELEFLQDLVNETTADIARYNNSAAGIIQMMNVDADSLNGKLTSMLGEVKDAEGLELLSEIKNVVGTD